MMSETTPQCNDPIWCFLIEGKADFYRHLRHGPDFRGASIQSLEHVIAMRGLSGLHERWFSQEVCQSSTLGVAAKYSTAILSTSMGWQSDTFHDNCAHIILRIQYSRLMFRLSMYTSDGERPNLSVGHVFGVKLFACVSPYLFE